MKYNDYGQVIASSNDLCDLLYIDPTVNLSNFLVEDVNLFNSSVDATHYGTNKLTPVYNLDETIESFDQRQQSNWYMPAEYQTFDISKWVLDQCKTETELERVAHELVLFQERNLFMLLNYLKYLIDTFRKNNVVWGVGRGSSVASYVLYLIGVHRINSLKYNLSITEFLK
jgi:DNA polymerase III alpha subunit